MDMAGVGAVNMGYVTIGRGWVECGDFGEDHVDGSCSHMLAAHAFIRLSERASSNTHQYQHRERAESWPRTSFQETVIMQVSGRGIRNRLVEL